MITQCSKVFLGQKYGYRPIPTYILASELAQFREILLTMGQEVILLDTWYKKDSNAVPPVCILQPISSILVNFNNKVSLYHTIVQISTTNLYVFTQRVPKLQQEDQAKWWDTLDRMQKLLRKAATTLYAQGQLDFDSMHNYLMSGKATIYLAISIGHLSNVLLYFFSHGERSHPRSTKRTKYEESLLGLRSLHQQH